MKKLTFAALLLAAVCNQASANIVSDITGDKKDEGNALNGTWKWQKTYCGDEQLDAVESLFKSSTLTLNGEAGYVESESLPPFGKTHKFELGTVTYKDNNEVTLECTQPSREAEETREYCGEFSRTYKYNNTGGAMELDYTDPNRCATTLRNIYELQK